jgi:hypothetical protein
MGVVYTHGLMDESMTVNGKMVDNMVMVSTYLKQDNLEKVFGKMEKEKNG